MESIPPASSPPRSRLPRPRLAIAAAALCAGISLLLASCGEKPTPPAPPGANLSTLAETPDWSALAPYSGTITQAEFVRLLEGVFSEAGGATFKSQIKVFADRAEIRAAGDAVAVIRFAAGDGEAKRAPRYWRRASELPPAPPGKPLDGVHIALDPGHIGGRWAKMEERWYQIGGGIPVQEGDMALRVAALVKPMLEDLGARVSLVRDKTEPASEKRPEDFDALAREQLADYAGGDLEFRVRKLREQLFYRAWEIRARADLINGTLRPDLCVCLHFNAEAWGDPARPAFVPANHFHILMNGCYSLGEFNLDDNRFAAMHRLLQGIPDEEIAAAGPMAAAFERHTGMPPYVYTKPTARTVDGNPYLYARNLLANRVYRCPVIFLEPYVMNNGEVYNRIQLGDYEGLKPVNGRAQPSIFREYAAAVAEGLRDYYAAARGGEGGAR